MVGPATWRRSLCFVALVAVGAGACGEDASSGFDEATSSSTGGGAVATSGGSTVAGTGAGSGVGAGGAGGGGATPPAGLTRHLTGNEADADVAPTGPGIILMGGGPDVDAAFAWQRDRIAGGDVVVLRTSGSDGYNDYLFSQIGGADSVETLLVVSRDLADDPWVAARVGQAEAVFMAGGDQATYLQSWKDTALEAALMQVYARGGVLGGTSAGCALLGEASFAAYNGTVYPEEAMMDPYNQYMTFERDFLALPPLAGVITDTHFYERDRFGRLVSFVARIVQDGWASQALGLGVDEATALLIDGSGQGTVVGEGYVYAVTGGPPAQCQPGAPLDHTVSYRILGAGDAIDLPAGTSTVPTASAAVSGGTLSPSNPY